MRVVANVLEIAWSLTTQWFLSFPKVMLPVPKGMTYKEKNRSPASQGNGNGNGNVQVEDTRPLKLKAR